MLKVFMIKCHLINYELIMNNFYLILLNYDIMGKNITSNFINLPYSARYENEIFPFNFLDLATFRLNK